MIRENLGCHRAKRAGRSFSFIFNWRSIESVACLEKYASESSRESCAVNVSRLRAFSALFASAKCRLNIVNCKLYWIMQGHTAIEYKRFSRNNKRECYDHPRAEKLVSVAAEKYAFMIFTRVFIALLGLSLDLVNLASKNAVNIDLNILIIFRHFEEVLSLARCSRLLMLDSQGHATVHKGA